MLPPAQRLPPELLFPIASDLFAPPSSEWTGRADLVAFGRVCKAWNAVAESLLYRDVRVQREDWSSHRLDKLTDALEGRPELGQHVRRLEIAAEDCSTAAVRILALVPNLRALHFRGHDCEGGFHSLQRSAPPGSGQWRDFLSGLTGGLFGGRRSSGQRNEPPTRGSCQVPVTTALDALAHMPAVGDLEELALDFSSATKQTVGVDSFFRLFRLASSLQTLSLSIPSDLPSLNFAAIIAPTPLQLRELSLDIPHSQLRTSSRCRTVEKLFLSAFDFSTLVSFRTSISADDPVLHQHLLATRNLTHLSVLSSTASWRTPIGLPAPEILAAFAAVAPSLTSLRALTFTTDDAVNGYEPAAFPSPSATARLLDSLPPSLERLELPLFFVEGMADPVLARLLRRDGKTALQQVRMFKTQTPWGWEWGQYDRVEEKGDRVKVYGWQETLLK
ncbi:hypothetical protein JCM6882_009020 [Rhodosporidiobolus microsporus]